MKEIPNTKGLSQSRIGIAVSEAAAGRQPDVHASVDNLGYAIQRLEDSVNELLDRLSPVTRQDPCGNQTKCERHAGSCRVSEELWNQVERINEVIARVRDQISALEV